MESPCLFLPCMPVILSVFAELPEKCSKVDQPEKNVITEQTLWILLKPMAYSSLWAIIFQQNDFKLPDVANNAGKVRKLAQLFFFLKYVFRVPGPTTNTWHQ